MGFGAIAPILRMDALLRSQTSPPHHQRHLRILGKKKANQEGISVGYGDDYKANLEGQYLPLRGLPAGRYTLVHTVNADRRLRERRFDNNAASLLLELRWQDRRPTVRVLRTCADTDRCARPID